MSELFEVNVERASAGKFPASATATFANLKAAGWRVFETSGEGLSGGWVRLTAEKRFDSFGEARAEFRGCHA